MKRLTEVTYGPSLRHVPRGSANLMRPCRAIPVAALLLMSVCCFLLMPLSPSYGQETDGQQFFKAGREALQSGDFKEAVASLTRAQKDFALLGDYVLLDLADAYHGLGDHAKSLESLRLALKTYPISPLVKEARGRIIREAQEMSSDNLMSLFEDYVADYPEDERMAFAYATRLKEVGRLADSDAVFKELYVSAGAFSQSSFANLKPGEITSSDLIERASNLTSRYAFKEAEDDLRRALRLDDGKRRDEIRNGIGKALFRQKKYEEAAAVFAELKDTYSAARSLYRAGDEEGFETALKKLLDEDDARAADLLVALASDKRRGRDFEGAVALYTDALKRFPGEKEAILWGTGWTYYLADDYEKASAIFSNLYADYGDTRYLYWQARSVEAGGGDADRLYSSLVKTGNNFYTVLCNARGRANTVKPVASGGQNFDRKLLNDRRFRRVDALLSLGMSHEAARELVFLSREAETREELKLVISKLYELGEFRRSIGLVTKTPYSEDTHRYWYPLAFWDDVSSAAKKYDLDPVIVLAVMREESRFDASARSVAGARGLMQIMPRTAYRLDKTVKLGIRKDVQVEDVKNNIRLGAYYLKSLLDEFGSLASVLAAYNAGETVVKRWQQQGQYRAADEFIEDIPYGETRNYVKKVITSYFQYKKYFADNTAGMSFGIILGKL